MHMHHSDKLYALEYMSVTAVFIASFYFRKENRFVTLFFCERLQQVRKYKTHTQRGNVPVQGKRKKREKED
jgi:hypothetical protein